MTKIFKRFPARFTLLIISTFLLLAHGGDQSLIGTDEGYYAQMAREITQSKEWLVPTFLGGYFFEKPPLLQWLMALSFQVFGISEWSARAPSWIAGILVIQLTYWLGRYWLSPRGAFWSALILSGTHLWLMNGRVAGQDMLLTCLELTGIICLLIAQKQGYAWLALGWGVMVGLGLLLKSVMILLSVVALLPYLWLARSQHRLLRNPYLYLGLGVGLAGCGAWLGAVYLTYGDRAFLTQFGLLGKVVNLGTIPFAGIGPWFYLWNLPKTTFPWFFFALGGLYYIWKNKQITRYLLLYTYPLVFMTLLQLFTTKTAYYPLQIAPFIALLAGYFLVCLTEEESNKSLIAWISFSLGAVAFLMLMVSLTIYMNPGLVNEKYLIYRPVGMVWGWGWLLCLLLRRNTLAWSASVLGGPILAFSLAVVLNIFGNYSPEFKRFAQQNLSISGPVDIVYEGTEDRVSEFIELAFYTPRPGFDLRARQVRQGKGHGAWWLSPESRIELQRNHYDFRVIAVVRGWTLAQTNPSKTTGR